MSHRIVNLHSILSKTRVIILLITTGNSSYILGVSHIYGMFAQLIRTSMAGLDGLGGIIDPERRNGLSGVHSGTCEFFFSWNLLAHSQNFSDALFLPISHDSTVDTIRTNATAIERTTLNLNISAGWNVDLIQYIRYNGNVSFNYIYVSGLVLHLA